MSRDRPLGEIEMIGLDDDPTAVGSSDVRLERGGRSLLSRRGRVVAVAAATAVLVTGLLVSSKSARQDPALSDATLPGTSLAPTLTFVPTTVPAATVLGKGPLLGELTGLDVWFEAYWSNVSRYEPGVYRLNLDAATLQHVGPPQLAGPQTPVSFVDASGFHLFADSTIVVHSDGTIAAGRFFFGSVLEAGADGLWVQNVADGRREGQQNTIEHRSIDGSLLAEFLLPRTSTSALAAGGGRFAIQAIDGRSYLVDVAAASVVPVDGSVLAANGGSIVVVRCSSGADCGATFIGRDGRTFPVDVPLDPSATMPVTVSPDGEWLLVPRSVGAIQRDDALSLLTAYKPATGESVSLGAVSRSNRFGYGTTGAWSPDGRWFFALTTTGFAAWHPGLDAPLVALLGGGVPQAQAIAAGPAALGP
jgi:hypothetical protein